jgi:hypothetical protein
MLHEKSCSNGKIFNYEVVKVFLLWESTAIFSATIAMEPVRQNQGQGDTQPNFFTEKKKFLLKKNQKNHNRYAPITVGLQGISILELKLGSYHQLPALLAR